MSISSKWTSHNLTLSLWKRILIQESQRYFLTIFSKFSAQEYFVEPFLQNFLFGTENKWCWGFLLEHPGKQHTTGIVKIYYNKIINKHYLENTDQLKKKPSDSDKLLLLILWRCSFNFKNDFNKSWLVASTCRRTVVNEWI